MTANFPIYLLVMAGVTYLIRMLPLTIFRKEIKSTFVKSFLHYVPFAVLGAMTIPDVLYSTGDMRTAAVGLVVAVFLAWKGKSLLTVALAACWRRRGFCCCSDDHCNEKGDCVRNHGRNPLDFYSRLPSSVGRIATTVRAISSARRTWCGFVMTVRCPARSGRRGSSGGRCCFRGSTWRS